MSTVAFLSAAPFLHAIFAALSGWGGVGANLFHEVLRINASSWGGVAQG